MKNHKRHAALVDQLRTKVRQVIAKSARAIEECFRGARESARVLDTTEASIAENFREYDRAAQAIGAASRPALENSRARRSSSGASQTAIVSSGAVRGSVPVNDDLGLD